MADNWVWNLGRWFGLADHGWEAFLSELKARGISLPFVVLTGHPMDQLTEVTALDGVVDKLQKPPDLLTLAETVGRILRTGEQSPITL